MLHLVHDHLPPPFVPLLPHEIAHLFVFLNPHNGSCLHTLEIASILSFGLKVIAVRLVDLPVTFKCKFKLVDPIIHLLSVVAHYPFNSILFFFVLFFDEILLLSQGLFPDIHIFFVVLQTFGVPVLHESHVPLDFIDLNMSDFIP